VSPASAPLSCGVFNCSAGTVDQRVWLPPGEEWVEFPSLHNDAPAGSSAGSAGSAPVVHSGGQWLNATCTLDDVPVYAKRGALLPMRPYAAAVRHGSASAPFDALELWLFGAPAAGTRRRRPCTRTTA